MCVLLLSGVIVVHTMYVVVVRCYSCTHCVYVVVVRCYSCTHCVLLLSGVIVVHTVCCGQVLWLYTLCVCCCCCQVL